MNLTKIKLNNFRNYKGDQTFDLDSSIIILYGENGNGKSSFFDGLEWCLTGKISRFPINSQAIKEVIANKEMLPSEKCYVEVYFDNLFLRRSFNLNNDGFGNIEISLFKKNTTTDREYVRIARGDENVNNELKKHIGNADERLFKNLPIGEMINKAYVLSQDQITDFVSKDSPSAKYEALASIMGFEKVVKLRNNIMQSISYLNQLEERTKEDIDNLTTEKKDYESQLININYGDKAKFSPEEIEHVNITTLTDKITFLKSEILNYERDLKEIKSMAFENIDNLKTMESSIHLIENEIKMIDGKIEHYLIEDENIKNSLDEIEENIKKVIVQEKQNHDLKKMKIEAEEYKNELLLEGITLEETSLEKLTEELKESILMKNRLNYTLTHKEKYQQISNFSEFKDVTKETLTSSLNANNFLLNELNDKSNRINQELSNKEMKSNISQLIQSINGIQLYLKEVDTNGKCPVCSSDHGNELDTVISENLKKSLEVAGKHSENLKEKMNVKNDLEVKIKQQKNKISEVTTKINEFEEKLSQNEIELNTIIGSKLYKSELFIIDKETIEKLVLDVKTKVKKINDTLILLNKHEEILKKINSKNDSSIKIINISMDKLRENQKELFGKRKSNKDNLDFQKKNKETLQTKHFQQSFYKDRYRKLFLDKYQNESFTKIIKIVEREIEHAEKEIHKYDSLLPLISSIESNKNTSKNIANIIKKEGILLEYLKELSQKENSLNQIIDNLDERYGDKASSFLNNDHSPIQTYYKYLNPNPSEFNRLLFEIKDNKDLYITFENQIDGRENAEINYLLSSGQLNVLALSIFIATNEAQNFSYFNFLAIDDPIQNMDDVNRFSISDVLSSLKKQIIFSTHDQEFLNLFLKKNENRLDDIFVYLLNSEENVYKSILNNK